MRSIRMNDINNIVANLEKSLLDELSDSNLKRFILSLNIYLELDAESKQKLRYVSFIRETETFFILDGVIHRASFMINRDLQKVSIYLSKKVGNTETQALTAAEAIALFGECDERLKANIFKNFDNIVFRSKTGAR